MFKTLKFLFCAVLILSAIAAGIFCYHGMQQSMHAGCHGEATTFWCSDFLSHGTINSASLLISIFVFSFFITLVVLGERFFSFGRVFKSLILYDSRIWNEVPIRSFLQLAISRGIVNSRIP